MKVKQLLSRKAGCNSHGQDSSYFLGWQEYERNPYHHIGNPNGIIQMGLAENQLSFDVLESWLEENPEALTFKQDGKSVFREIALFQDYHGLPAFKHALAEMMSEIRGNKVRFDPNNLVLTAGATSANEALIFTLADPGDAFLVPTPYYPGFDRDLKWRTGVEIVPIECHSYNGFKITQTALEAALKSAHKRNLKVKGVLFTNPSNPLGTTTTRPELHHLLRFAAAHDLHLVADEIYAGTTFASPDFISIYEALSEAMHEHPDLHDRVHIVTSLSKDLGLPGFRVGAIYSDNKPVVAAATKMSSFGLISSQTQHLLGLMLGDKIFRSGYVAENRRRLRQRHRQLVDGLAGIGIPCLDSNAGLFCWVDMKDLMSSKKLEGEIKLWKELLHEVGLNISPGSSCHCSEPGWFRVCFANMSEETLGLAIDRLKRFVDGRRRRSTEVVHHGFGAKKVVQVLPKWVFRLSSSGHAESDR